MKRFRQVLLSMALLMTLAAATPAAQDDPQKDKTTASGQMKEGGKEMGRAGKSLGSNVKRGRVARGGKQFGKHVGRGSKKIAKGTSKAAKKTGSKIKKAVQP